MFRDQVIKAIRDYRYLLDRSYPQKSTIKLVGDRYKLTGEERSILYRGISDHQSAEIRRKKLIEGLTGDRILVDTHNVLFTIANYLNGRPVFVCDDGFLRDAGEQRGRIRSEKLVQQILELIFDFVVKNRNTEYRFFVDKPVSDSNILKDLIFQFFKDNDLAGTVIVSGSADQQIIKESEPKDIVCTSDSEIISEVNCALFDLPNEVISMNFNGNFLKLTDL
jgi:hypothetical protein